MIVASQLRVVERTAVNAPERDHHNPQSNSSPLSVASRIESTDAGRQNESKTLRKAMKQQVTTMAKARMKEHDTSRQKRDVLVENSNTLVCAMIDMMPLFKAALLTLNPTGLNQDDPMFDASFDSGYTFDNNVESTIDTSFEFDNMSD